MHELEKCVQVRQPLNIINEKKKSLRQLPCITFLVTCFNMTYMINFFKYSMSLNYLIWNKSNLSSFNVFCSLNIKLVKW